ncbi:MAG: prephenate dehydratase [Chromatiales bacterium]|nr:prephenate dehydratase [Chromatiales bacterium]
MSNPDELDKLRSAIDAIDRDLLDRISRRAELAARVAEVKRGQGETFFYRPEREAQVLRQVQAANPGPLSDATVAHLFREIMSACLALEQPLQVAFLGPRGTYTEAAAMKHFGAGVELVALGSIDEVFREVNAAAAQYGVVPIENSTEGVVTHTLDQFMNSPLKVCGEIKLPIHHCLMSRATDVAGVREVYAHQQALAQCRAWLVEHLPGVRTVAVASNAEAARLATEVDGAAAIAGERAAGLYELRILARNIEDDGGNTTRFLVIGQHEAPPSGRDKTSVMVSAHNRAGALVELLAPLAEHRVSMTRIESRPSRKAAWEYVFFVDIEGHAAESNVAAALAELARRANLFKSLGSYPVAAF